MTDRLTCDEVRELAAPFVLGALEPDEVAAVREHLATCDGLHEELAELGSVVPYLGESLEPVEPPVGLRARILAQAAADIESGLVIRREVPVATAVSPVSVTSDAASGTTTAAERREAERALSGEPSAGADRPGATGAPVNVIPIDRARSLRQAGSWALRIAAVVAIVALAGWNLLLQSDLGTARSYQSNVADALALAAQPGSRIAVLAPAANSGISASGIAVLPVSGAGRIVMRGLAPTSGSQVYEAWTIAPGATPQPAGGFTVGASGIGLLDSLAASAGGVTIALTLEPHPDPTAPTLPIISSGVATSASS